MKTVLTALASLLALITAYVNSSPETVNNNIFEPDVLSSSSVYVLKDVGEAYMDNFGLSDNDFSLISNAGFDVIEGNFDICASDEDVEYYLETSAKYDLEVIMPAGSGEAEWGYKCDEDYPADQKPVWQKEEVIEFINKWKGYKNIYAWDISNEAGSVFPNADNNYYLTEEQLQMAYLDVKSADYNRPVIIRMNGWFFYDFDSNYFREGNPYAKDVTDIIMINAYSNVDEYFSDFVDSVYDRSEKAIHNIDPGVGLIYALGVWEEPPLWKLPSEEQLSNDINSLSGKNILGTGFFKYGAQGSEYYLPEKMDIWNLINESI